MNEPKRTEPTRHLFAGHEYVHSTRTDIRARFAAIRAEQQQQAKQAANVAPIRKRK